MIGNTAKKTGEALLELGRWPYDISRYLRLLYRRTLMPAFSRGTDFSAPDYQDRVARLLERYHPHRMALELIQVIDETASTKTFRFQRIDGPLPVFRPGQYVNLFLTVGAVRTSRPYSISSRPGADHLDLTVRLKPDGFVAPYLLSQAKVGDRFESTGPAGQFYWEPLIDREKLVFLAGGSGITPFMSIIRDQAVRGWEVDIHLLYGCRTPDDVIFGRELEELAKKTDRLRYDLVISDPSDGYQGLAGFLDGDLLQRQLGTLDDRTFLVCGPNQMYELCLAELARLGVEPHRIRREAYGPPEEVTQQPGWPADLSPDTACSVEVEDHPPFQARAGEPLLAALERQGIVVPALCRSGGCSACRIKILAGKVFMPPTAGVRESDLNHGYVHACVAYPLEDLKIRL
ncbi:MAG: 2Fe-2S iron-sulfur cluster binding domain-containing protein [Bradymonadales bacterium]|nr:2Fe-2S iron-sulfur cluster binding domain-containing protein [Bradymonadales bacterium]